ncbi:MAG: glycosyltransferase family 2 protein, partial [Deltaproteobacteria bacterium]|nr:glycosyltransferase family 2 protein [Deltaproteobacteria bacterium]
TEDTDLTLRLILSGYRVRYDISALDYEQAVTTLVKYRKQRYRWAFGHQQVWRDYLRPSWRTSHLSLLEKIETTMFLWLYHVPVATFFSFFAIPYLFFGIGIAPPEWILVLVPILMLGPFLPIAVGLLQTPDARPRHAWMIGILLPVIIAFAFTCAHSWFNGVRGKGYQWAKTARSAQT